MDLLRPILPKFENYEHFIREIDHSHVYSNYGPFWEQFSSELSSWMKTRTSSESVHVSLVSSGTVAIELALKNLRLEGKTRCIVPSFTFIATIHAIKNAGLEPVLADIDPSTFALPVDFASDLPNDSLLEVGAVVVVSPFGAPLDLEAWERFQERTGIPVIVDAAAGITSISKIGNLAVCVSLHATKLLGIGEGGAVFTADAELKSEIDSQTGFGFKPGTRESSSLGGNYRLSEFACAIGVSALRLLPEKEASYFSLAKRYLDLIEDDKFMLQSGFGDTWVSSTINFLLPSTVVDQTKAALNSKSVPWRHWWGMGAHHHPVFRTSRSFDLSNTNEIAPRLIGVPFHLGLTNENLQTVIRGIRGN